MNLPELESSSYLSAASQKFGENIEVVIMMHIKSSEQKLLKKMDVERRYSRCMS